MGSAVKQYPTDQRGELDAGGSGRIAPCTKRTWCLLHDQHDGSCVVVPRYDIDRTNFGPGRK